MPAQALRRATPTLSGGGTTTSTPTGTATTSGTQAATATLPFTIGARVSSRFSFPTPTTSLGASAVPLPPVQIPAVGYLKGILLDITLTGTGGTSPAFTADAPFNVLTQVELRNSSGNDLIVPVTGYQLYCINKWGAQGFDTPYCDPRFNVSGTVPSAHFYLWVPCEVSPADAFCAIPALASNRSYQLALTLNALASVVSGSPDVSVTINGTALYWTEPVAQTSNAVAQQTAPAFNGSVNLWQLEQFPVTPGDKYLKSNNVGNVLRTLIFTLRNSSGAREDTDWPALCELYLDNNPMFYLPQGQWRQIMAQWSGYSAASGSLDTLGGQDTGVYVIPFYALAEGRCIANARRSQYLPTLDASLLQLRGSSFGSGASTLEILTNSVQPVNPTTGSSSSALYAIS